MQPVPDIAGLWTATAAEPGPHVAVTGLVHGDELCGRAAIERLLALGCTPRRGRLSLALVNLEAAREHRRYLDRDMNRLWRDDWLNDDRHSHEAARARELRPWLQTVDWVLDLHSTAFVARPFFVLADLAKTRALADAMGFPDAQQLMPGGCAEGRHLVDYGRFSDPADPATALTVECGRHQDPTASEVAFRVAVRFLEVSGAITAERARDLAAPPAAGAIERYRIGPPCVARTDRFALKLPLSGFIGVRQGALVALDGDEPVRAPFDAVIVSPRPAPRAQEIAFFWCRPVAGDGRLDA
jgi:predicted deacylase